MLSGIETVYGGNHADTFQAMNATSAFYALGGDDLVKLRNAGGVFNGGQGTDTLDFGLSTQAATVNLSTSWAGSGRTISNFENVSGGAFGDILTGSDVANVLLGRQRQRHARRARRQRPAARRHRTMPR